MPLLEHCWGKTKKQTSYIVGEWHIYICKIIILTSSLTISSSLRCFCFSFWIMVFLLWHLMSLSIPTTITRSPDVGPAIWTLNQILKTKETTSSKKNSLGCVFVPLECTPESTWRVLALLTNVNLLSIHESKALHCCHLESVCRLHVSYPVNVIPKQNQEYCWQVECTEFCSSLMSSVLGHKRKQVPGLALIRISRLQRGTRCS